MKRLVTKNGDHVTDLDDQNRIINGHHRVMTLLKMDIQLFIDDGVSITEARFATDDPPTLH